MEKDILVILMMAFGLFAILMFILFYIYAKKYYNEKHLNDDYHEDEECDLVNIKINGETIIFDSNNYELEVNNEVKVLMDNNTFDGVVVKGNYKELLSNIKETPRLLVIDNNNSKVEDEYLIEEIPTSNEEVSLNNDNKEAIVDYDDMDFMPKKKS